jgi:hypothetical protein
MYLLCKVSYLIVNKLLSHTHTTKGEHPSRLSRVWRGVVAMERKAGAVADADDDVFQLG